ncbi:MAG: adenylate kinase [Oculatellaceae cyanobacterium Prado106]|nr:adenylate kinase [Oculatellaceae cyanobacterium Prado106]
MRKVAVFGNAGGGKSTLSQKLAEITGFPLYNLDKIQYPTGDTPIPPEDFRQIHEQILCADQWVIDGFGSIETLWPRLDQADTLVYVDLPLPVHFGLVTKRLVTGFFHPPEGWPENSPLLKSSMQSYQVLWLCHKRLTPKYRAYVEQAQRSRKVYWVRSLRQVTQLLKQIEKN